MQNEQEALKQATKSGLKTGFIIFSYENDKAKKLYGWCTPNSPIGKWVRNREGDKTLSESYPWPHIISWH